MRPERRGCYPRTRDWNIPVPKAGARPKSGYGRRVPKLLSCYPDGVPGAALLLMRLSCALAAFPALARLSPTPHGAWAITFASALIALALAMGFGTRAGAFLLAAALAAGLFTARGETALLALALVGGAVALVLLGAGAYSVDAHRFGRRVIRLEPRSPDRGGSG